MFASEYRACAEDKSEGRTYPPSST